MECPVEGVWVVVPVREMRGSWFSRLVGPSIASLLLLRFPRRFNEKAEGSSSFECGPQTVFVLVLWCGA